LLTLSPKTVSSKEFWEDWEPNPQVDNDFSSGFPLFIKVICLKSKDDNLILLTITAIMSLLRSRNLNKHILEKTGLLPWMYENEV